MRTGISNVRVFDGEGLTGLRTVVFVDGRIANGDSAETMIDGQGGTLLPGLIDSHIHLDGIGNLEQAAHWGVTTMLDMGTASPKLVESLRNRPGLTDIRSSESPASAPGGTQTTMMGFPAETAVTGPRDAERFVAARVAEGADYIKIIVENPKAMGRAALDAETIAVLVRAAHSRGLRVFAHATNLPAFELAVGAKVDIVTHVPLDAPVSQALLDDMLTNGTLAVPTLVMMRGAETVAKSMPTHLNISDYKNAERSVTEMRRRGIPILAGTDSNAAPGSPFKAKHGESLHEELQLLVAAGLTPVEALHTATSLPAKKFDLKDRGSITPGLRADLLLVESDPTVDIAATRQIRGVWIAGERVR